MKNKLSNIIKIFISLVIITGVVGLVMLIKDTKITKAFGDFIVTFPSSPFFHATNLAPGDVVNKSLTIMNSGTLARMVAIKADQVYRNPASNPNLDDTLTMEISESSNILYGPTELNNFLNNTNTNGTILYSLINPSQTKNYDFNVVFPTGAGNEYQARSVEFDLHVGYVLGSNVVINEAFTYVDANHGIDCVAGNKTQTQGQCDEWVELFNPTNQDIVLKNWKIADASGIIQTITANKTIKANSFALLVKSNSTFSLYWKVPSGVQVIEMGQWIGDGLGNAGDRLRLINPSGNEVDAISWGTDAYSPNYTGPVTQGHSIERLTPGFDTDAGSDFTDRITPSPGL